MLLLHLLVETFEIHFRMFEFKKSGDGCLCVQILTVAKNVMVGVGVGHVLSPRYLWRSVNRMGPMDFRAVSIHATTAPGSGDTAEDKTKTIALLTYYN